MKKKGFGAVLLSILLSACALVGCGDNSQSDDTNKPSTDVETDKENGGKDEEIVEPSDPVNGFLIKIKLPNSCCKMKKKVFEVKRGETPISLPTPECEQDEHTFKYWKLDGQQLLRVSDIWSRIDENATEITLTAYCKRNWTNNH